jgi:hypothetical protein
VLEDGGCVPRYTTSNFLHPKNAWDTAALEEHLRQTAALYNANHQRYREALATWEAPHNAARKLFRRRVEEMRRLDQLFIAV